MGRTQRPSRAPAAAFVRRSGSSSSVRLGYACLNTLLGTPARTVRLANASPQRLRELIAANLDALEAILRWNEEHGIQVFRLTSNLIPFGSHDANPIAWWDEFGDRFARLAVLVADAGARLSTHPGQYTVLASAQPEVAAAAVAEVEYHARLLGALGFDASHKIVLHVGVGMVDAPATAGRLVRMWERLSDAARRRVVLENDERWPLEDVLGLSARLDCPVVLDVFHHTLAPSLPELSVRELVLAAGETWGTTDGRQEVHFSTQDPARRPGAHAASLDIEAFRAFHEQVRGLPLDCILELKDKEQSVLRARVLVETDPQDPA